VERLVDEVVGMPGGLPLLSYALSQLYFAYVDAGRGDRLLTAADLAAIGGDATASEGPVAAGGIVRILRKAADGVVQALPDGPHRETLWRVLLRMVNLVGVRPTRRRVPSWELVYPDPAENRRRKAVLAELIGEKARLLVSGPDPEAGKAIRVAEEEEEPDAIIEPAHDELLVAWPELARRIEAARVLLPIHRRLGEAAAEWWAGGCRTRDLDLRLLGLVETGDLPQDWLNKVEDRYVTAAREERRWRTRRRWTAAVVAFLAISGAALFFYDQSQRNARLSYQSRIQGLVNQAGADLDAGRTARGLLLARQAFGFLDRSRGHWASRMGLSLPWISSRDEVDLEARIDQVFRRVMDDLPPSFVVLRDPWSSEPVAFHPGGRLLVTVHRSTPVLVTLPEKGVQPEGPVQPLAGVPAGAALQTIAFSADGRFLAVGFFGGALCVWRLDGTPPAPVPGTPVCAAGRGAVTGLAFRPGTSALVAGRDDGTGAGSLQVWEVAGGQGRPPRLTRGFERPLPEGVQSLAVSPSGDLFLSLKRTAGVLRGTLDPQAALAPLEAPADQEVESLTLDDSGRLLAGLVTPGGEILGWELPEGRPFSLNRQGTAGAMALAQAGDHLVTVDNDERLSRIGGELPAEPEEVRIPSLCDSGPVEVAVPRGGQRIAVFCDGALRLWEPGPMEGDASRGIGRTHVSVFGMPTAFAALPGSATPLAIADANGDVELHDLKTGQKLHIPHPSSTGMLGLDLTLSPGLGSSFGGSGITGVAWGPGGTVLHVLAQDGLWWTYDVLTRTVGTRRLGGRVCAAAGSADGVWLAVLFDPLSSAPILALYKSDGAPVSLPPPPSARGASSLSGAGLPVFPISRYTVAGRCKAGLAFHPDRTELAVGIGNAVSLYDVPADGRWRSRRIAETRGMIFAAAWKGDLLAIGGGVAGATSDGFVELLGMDGGVRYTWTVPGAAVSGLAFEPGGGRLAASTDGGGVYVWTDGASGPSAILGKSGDFTEFPQFLEPGRVAALTSGGASVWSLGTRELADTFCATAASNLESRDWVNYVDADLGRYEPACPALPFHPSLLGQADSLAAAGRGEEAQRLYRWINELEPGSVVNPARRARGQALAAELSGFDAMDRQGVLAGLRRAEEHEELRRAEDLLPLPKDALIRLCRRSVLFGEARRALPFCEDGVKLHGDVGAARDSRGLALAVLGQLVRAREDFLASRDWLEEPSWRERRQAWIVALGAGRNPITPQVLCDIAREELKVDPSAPPAAPN
ncbi:MAG TPA: WD40 repeat domain-containing protein, partial [Thermoanaerobaculia bacterium]|nr:WD40 repeat domain-containing protein [Thermoanaerobaculia bacterium]